MKKFRYYKYAPLDRYTLTNLINETIYFNQVSNFDDPTDSAFTILTNEADQGPVQEDKILELFEFEKSPIKYDKENVISVAFMFPLLESVIRNCIGVACFSKHEICHSCNCPLLNPLMLSHYSNEHTGAAIEYECLNDSIFTKIEYDNKYSYFGYREILNNINFIKDKHAITINKKICAPLTHKFIEWSYQSEHRIFDQPLTCKSLDGLGLKIKRIFFACKSDPSIREAIQKIKFSSEVEFLFLGTPKERNESKRVIIYSSDKLDATRINSCKRCTTES